jgi:hypothetical protein
MQNIRFVPEIPDLIRPEEYASDPDGRRVRIQLRVTPEGVEVVGDAARAEVIERILAGLDPAEIEQMLCG